MSSRTPEECVEIAQDDGADEDDRADAIHDLQLANECDELDELVRATDLESQYRERALEALATPQCDSTLRNLADDDSLDDSLREQASTLLEETPDVDNESSP